MPALALAGQSRAECHCGRQATAHPLPVARTRIQAQPRAARPGGYLELHHACMDSIMMAVCFPVAMITHITMDDGRPRTGPAARALAPPFCWAVQFPGRIGEISGRIIGPIGRFGPCSISGSLPNRGFIARIAAQRGGGGSDS